MGFPAIPFKWIRPSLFMDEGLDTIDILAMFTSAPESIKNSAKPPNCGQPRKTEGERWISFKQRLTARFGSSPLGEQGATRVPPTVPVPSDGYSRFLPNRHVFCNICPLYGPFCHNMCNEAYAYYCRDYNYCYID